MTLPALLRRTLRAATAFLGLLIAGFPIHAATSDHPNIVFILCDDLGIDDLHCYGRPDHQTPHLDQLAREGMRFTSAYCAQPICSPSRAGLLTGKTPARLHLTTYLPGRADSPAQKLLHPIIRQEVDLSEKSMARYFKQAGYVTAAIGKWHIGGKGYGPEEHGFDVVLGGPNKTTPSATEGSKGEFGLTRSAEKFLEEHRDQPFLLYLAHYTPHIPYAATPEQTAAHKDAFEPVYAAVISSMDKAVGQLLAKLDALHLRENTIVVFTSDNGGLHVPEANHQRVTHNTPYRAGKGYLYEGGLRIPLIVRWPGHLAAGVTVDTPIINTGWIPTLLELAGQPAPSGLDAGSFASILKDPATSPEQTFLWHFPHYNNQGGRPGGAVREGDWKLIEYYDAPDAPELYLLTNDIGEKKNLAASYPGRVTAMRKTLADWRTAIGAQSNTPNPDFDPARYRKLYVDFDPSRFDPLHATSAEWAAVQDWRSGMNAAVQGRSSVKSKAPRR
ncbi:MAG: sulfatase [Opitutaceae bacterium]|nr:sulfatase [Opitutaceae bacterium]